MKLFLASLALALSGFSPLALHADPILSLSAGGVAKTLIETPVLGGATYTYVDVDTSLFRTTTQTFTAVFTDIAGVKLLNVTDVCANVVILGRAKACDDLAFSFTDLGFGKATLLSTLGVAGVNVAGDVIGINFGASIGGGSASFRLDPPPPAVSAVPEPGTFGLMGTGMLGVAGAVRRRLTSV